VSVRKPDDYSNAGHIPHATNIYWGDIVKDENLARLDSTKTLIIYCYYGHASMLSYTILGLLGYRCHSLDFGMMDWNVSALVKPPWDQEADYEVEGTPNISKETCPPPVIAGQQGDTKSIIKEMARTYLAGEGSPVITSSDVKAIVDDWDHKKAEYQIVCVGSKRDYEIGHVPNSIHIPWADIAEVDNLKKLDPSRTGIVYSDNGQTGQMAATVLNLLGYRAVDMRFGMMDWNKAYVDRSKQWDGVADYPVECGN
jgi:rhodanese-related sulfurtransferase